MYRQLRVCGLTILPMLPSASFAIEMGEHPYEEPMPSYLREFAKEGGKVFVLERFDAEGRLVDRSIDRVSGEITITGAVERRIAEHDIQLRGLNGCPTKTVTYNRVQTWTCIDAVRDYAGAIYNRRAHVILCKTLMLSTAQGQTIPASCFALVGGDGEPYRTVNDDDSMVFLGLAEIGKTPAGRLRRPDLEHAQSLSKKMEFQNAD
ncbi:MULTISPECIES: hypothetical protein [unclassified Rhizobium]|uniref:hypothetical protein n=1 Tax=unclassified Rhizobium TaxID=2613769 RepID=UPI0006F1DC74|nr:MULTISPECIES: hypothetical protein [unclassified Rhizobium]KQV40528.1 hypothetical protein ASC86_21670 [Rhizobium sp. Root1212]KRD35573.1 hypothetical protein ASE37_20960 [Rhizobium sp. Root268]